jgi:hypothetical protein
LWEPGLSQEEFDKLEASYAGEDFNDYMIDGVQSYTFENPSED